MKSSKIAKYFGTVFLSCALVLASVAPVLVYGTQDVKDEHMLKFAISSDRTISIDRVVSKVFQAVGYDTTFSYFGTETCVDYADNGIKDGVLSKPEDDVALHENLIQVPTSLADVELVAYAKNGYAKKVKTWEDLKGQRIAVISQKPQNVRKANEYGSKTIIKETVTELINGLSAGEFDVFVYGQQTTAQIPMTKGVTRVGVVEYRKDYIYLNKKFEALVVPLDNAIKELKANGTIEQILTDEFIDDPTAKIRMLHVTSFDMETLSEQQFDAGLNSYFENDPMVDMVHINLDSKRFPDAEARFAYFANILRQDFVLKRPTIIVTSGDQALDFVKQYYFKLFRNTPVVFSGIYDYKNEKIEGFEDYFTGITVKVTAEETVTEMLRLFPSTKNIYVINDHLGEGIVFENSIKQQLVDLPSTVTVEYSGNLAVTDLAQKLQSLDKDTVVLVGAYFADGSGKYMSLESTMELFQKNCKNPIGSLYSSNVDYGETLGVGIEYRTYGSKVGAVAKKIADKSVNVSKVPILKNDASLQVTYYNWVKLKEFGLTKADFAETAIMYNKPQSIWQTDPKLLTLAIILVALGFVIIVSLITYSSVLKRKNEQLVKIQQSLHTAEEMLSKDAKIKEILSRQERIISSAPLAYMLTIKGRIVEANEYMQTELGVVIGEEAINYYSYVTEREEFMIRFETEDIILNLILNLKLATGENRRFHCNLARLQYDDEEAFVLWGIDIENEERQREMLKAAQDDMQLVLDALPIAVRIRTLTDNQLIYVNKAFLELFEFDTMEQAISSKMNDLFPEYQPDGSKTFARIEEETRSLLNTKHTRFSEMTYRTINGRLFDSEFSACAINYQGKRGSLSIIKDMTKEKQQAQMLVTVAEKEKEANQLKSRFLVNMSHEIRTPMNAIIGLTEIELRKPLQQDMYDLLTKINSSAKNLLQIINDILDLSKIEAEKMELYESCFLLEETLNSALLVVTPRLDGKHVELMLDVAPDLPLTICGDKVRLWQVLKNFLDNAAKYTDEGSIICSVYKDQIKMSEPGTMRICFNITDTGIGIEDVQLEKLFIPFKQIYNTAQQKYTGTGLGMAISKELAEIMGGEINIKSEPGVGTSITATIPFKLTDNKNTQSKSFMNNSLDNKRILIADDSPQSLLIMQDILQQNNVKCVTVPSGNEAVLAVKEAERKGETFDLILLDYMMEGKNGIDTAAEINKILHNTAKLIMVTAYQRSLIKLDLERNSFLDVIEKPFIPTQFIRQLCTAINGGRDSDMAQQEIKHLTTFKDVKILVCEDNELNQEVAFGMLSQFGIVPVMAENGKVGLELLKETKFDLIFMDLQMPIMDGYATTKAIRADNNFKLMPIVSLTADAMTEVVADCLAVGMNDYLTKPIEFDRMQAVLLKWLPEEKRVSVIDTTPVTLPDNKDIPHMDGINIKTGLARFNKNTTNYKNALREFARTMDAQIPPLSEAFKDMARTKSEIHRLKGVSGNLAVDCVYKLVVEFENALHEEINDKQLYEQLLGTMGIIKEVILTSLKEDAKDVATSKLEGTKEQFLQYITSLNDALKNFDPLACAEIVEEMELLDWAESLVELSELEKLYACVNSYEFEEGAEITSRLLG